MKRFVRWFASTSLLGLLAASAATGCASSAEPAPEATGPSPLVAEAQASELLAAKLDALASRGWAAADWAQVEQGASPDDGTPYVAVPVSAAQPDGTRATAKLYYVPGDAPRVIAVADPGASHERLRGDVDALLRQGDGEGLAAEGAPRAELTAGGEPCGASFCTERAVYVGYWWACLQDAFVYVQYRRECGRNLTDTANNCSIAGIASDACGGVTSTPGRIEASIEWTVCGAC